MSDLVCYDCRFYDQLKTQCKISGNKEPVDGWCCRFILSSAVITMNQIQDLRNE